MAAGEAHRIAGVLLLGGPLLGLPAHAQMTCDPCKVGVVFDGPWELNALLRESFEEGDRGAGRSAAHGRLSSRRAARRRLDARWSADGGRSTPGGARGGHRCFFLTELCRPPTTMSPAPSDSRRQLSRGRPARDRLAAGPPQINWVSRARSPSCACSTDFPDRRPWRSTERSCGSPPCNCEPTARRSTVRRAGLDTVRAPASVRFRCRRRRTAGAVPGRRGAAA